jgi:hypothetical protein
MECALEFAQDAKTIPVICDTDIAESVSCGLLWAVDFRARSSIDDVRLSVAAPLPAPCFATLEV